jgi:thiamine biosynthesis lipoprotein
MPEVHVFETMGTVASLTGVEDAGVVSEIELEFADFDRTFSLYRNESELSRIARGEVALTEASERVRESYALAVDWRQHTGGAFTPHRADGVIDLNGVVKAQAMDAAADILHAAGLRDWCLNVGGDVIVSGSQPDGSPWIVGIADPGDRAYLLSTIELTGTRVACATSGSAERGDHIWTPGDLPSPFVQATVLADDILTADVLATAIIAGGEETLAQATRDFSIDVLVVDRAGELRATPGYRAAVSSAG